MLFYKTCKDFIRLSLHSLILFTSYKNRARTIDSSNDIAVSNDMGAIGKISLITLSICGSHLLYRFCYTNSFYPLFLISIFLLKREENTI